MNTDLFDEIGLYGMDLSIIILVLLGIILVLFIMVIVVLVKLSKLSKKYNAFMTGQNAESLEQKIYQNASDNANLKSITEKNTKDIRKLYHQLQYTYQKCGVVKYDAFQQMGGKLSFSLALLNKKNDGFVLNSVHSSDGCYSYTKVIKNGKCDIPLGEEEEQAVSMAIG